MPRTPGSGRKKGTPNSVTTGARRLILDWLERRTPEELDALWEGTKAEGCTNAFKLWVAAQEFVLPRLGRTEHTGEDGAPIVVEIVKASRDPT